MKIAVLGGGNGAQSMAADLTLRGFEVNLYELPNFKKNIEPILAKGGIQLIGAARIGFAKVSKVTTQIQDAIEDADVIMLVVPAYGHLSFFQVIAPHLTDGQTVVINPGNYGALRFSNMLKEMRITRDVTIAETLSLIYACRLAGPAKADILAVKKEVPIAALPAKETERVVRLLSKVFPQMTPAKNVLETSLNNPNHVLHTAPSLLNAGRIESTAGNFSYYGEGITPSVARVLEIVDKERVSVIKALGLNAISCSELFEMFYGITGNSLYEVVQNSKVLFTRSRAPPTLQYRYITEDVPYGLVPIASFGDLLGCPTTAINTIIELASLVNQVDYFSEGVTAEKLGLAELSAEDINKRIA